MSLRLRFDNHTHFQTRVLRAVILAVAREVFTQEGKSLDSLYVRVKYARTWGQAHAALGYGRMSLFYRKTGQPTWDKAAGRWVRPRTPHQPALRQVADTVRHELMHCLGYSHAQFYDRPVSERTITALLTKYGTVLPIRPPRRTPSPDERVDTRYARALAAVGRWERKVKLANTMLRKARRRVAGYERRRAARPSTIEGGLRPGTHLG